VLSKEVKIVSDVVAFEQYLAMGRLNQAEEHFHGCAFS
jgi:hypothetical protein